MSGKEQPEQLFALVLDRDGLSLEAACANPITPEDAWVLMHIINRSGNDIERVVDMVFAYAAFDTDKGLTLSSRLGAIAGLVKAGFFRSIVGRAFDRNDPEQWAMALAIAQCPVTPADTPEGRSTAYNHDMFRAIWEAGVARARGAVQ